MERLIRRYASDSFGNNGEKVEAKNYETTPCDTYEIEKW
jgi:hypothetical protein